MAHMAWDETFHDSPDFQTFVWKREKCFAIARIGRKLFREEEETEKGEARKGKDRIARICRYVKSRLTSRNACISMSIESEVRHDTKEEFDGGERLRGQTRVERTVRRIVGADIYHSIPIVVILSPINSRGCVEIL